MKLYATNEIAEMYGVSSATITNNWCCKGLKFLKGEHHFLFKLEWIDEFLEIEGQRQADLKMDKSLKKNKKIENVNCKTANLPKFNKDMKII